MYTEVASPGTFIPTTKLTSLILCFAQYLVQIIISLLDVSRLATSVYIYCLFL